MDLNQLKTFVTVAEEQHLTRAAERLFTSQPAVSAQLKALEGTLGVTLFDRTPKGMQITPAGQTLLPQARAALEAAHSVLTHAKAIQGQVNGTLSIGINTDFAFLRLAQILASTQADYPDIKLSFVNSMSPDIIIDIRKGNLDTGFIYGPCTSADLSVIFLERVETNILAPIGWADRARDASLAELAALPWVYTTEKCPFIALKKALFAGTNLDPAKLVYVDNEDAMRELVRAGAGIAILRSDIAELAEREGWGIRWAGAVPTIDLSIAVQARRLKEPMIQAWLQQVKKHWPKANTPELARDAI
ncbi:MAG: LysR family transcriptional regulator [Pseudomonadales bacterium]|uniref:LysR substrate-binding protein n=1 Tax=Oleiphilus messinensis TaxID=141451 RepID=A0A1Y0I7T6_9GAMM|nr:LysR family transcriptional regulator [Oleiphilus messinensis]ARU55463.1 LysR substrate-binding protein [Oleiphilus messinensis]MCG8612382.1 LysR family transcriptional regulator [Pseudomonadales bacterium]